MPAARTSLSVKVEEGHTALMCAALTGDAAKVKHLLRRSAHVNAKDDEGHTALMFAVVNLHLDIVKALLEHEADVNARANDGGTALIFAALCGDAGIVQALLDKGADPEGSYVQTGQTAESLAAERGYTNIVELLKKAGAGK